jgi:nitrogen fixation protein FixH
MIAVLAITVAANVWLLAAANDPGASAVEPDYYRQALAWDSTAALAEASARLGWAVDAAIGPLDREGRARLEVRLADRGGQPVRGAAVRVVAISNLESLRHVVTPLAAEADGYAAIADLRHRGLWELRVEAVRDTETFAAHLRRDVGAGFAR